MSKSWLKRYCLHFAHTSVAIPHPHKVQGSDLALITAHCMQHWSLQNHNSVTVLIKYQVCHCKLFQFSKDRGYIKCFATIHSLHRVKKGNVLWELKSGLLKRSNESRNTYCVTLIPQKLIQNWHTLQTFIQSI